MRCPRRDENPSSIHKYPQEDTWEEEDNGDRTCSYCGSMSPIGFVAFLQEVLTNKSIEVRIEPTDKPYKYYVKRPTISNASEGAIKFYMHHAPKDDTKPGYYEPEFIELLNRAIKVSVVKFEKFMVEFKKSL